MSNRRDSRPVTLLVSVTALLVIWGLLTVFNTSSAEIIDRAQARSTHAALTKQGIYTLIGLIAAVISWSMGLEPLLKRPWLVWAVASFLLLLCLVPGIGQAANGASRWIRLGSISVQPSEIAKILLPLATVGWLRSLPRLNWFSFARLMGLLALPIALILLEPDNGTTLIAAFTIGLILFLAAVPAQYWALPMGILLLGGVLMAIRMPHVHRRLEIYLHPESDLRGKGHQPYQARIAVGSGGLVGRGLGNGLQKLEYLPEAQNDYIAAIVAEETGFIGMVGLVGLYCCLLMAGMWIALRVDSWNRVLASSLTALLAVQAFLNLAVVSGLLPSTGINLPLFSQGGTSLLCNLILIGWLIRLAQSEKERVNPPHVQSQEIQKAARITFSARYWQENPKSLA